MEPIYREKVNRSSNVNEPLGVIYGNVSTEEFRFAVRAADVTKGSFIKVKHDIFGWILGYITVIERHTDLTFMEARNMHLDRTKDDLFRGTRSRASRGSVRPDVGTHAGSGDLLREEGSVLAGKSGPTGSPNLQRRDFLGEGNVSASVIIFGYRDKRGVLQLPATPLIAGKPVFLAENELLKDVVGLVRSRETGAYVGKLKGHDLEVYLDINEMVQKHISVIARTGSGKSYVVGVLVEELLEKDIPVVIIDPHGEYSSLIQPNLNDHDIKRMKEFRIRPKGYTTQVTEFSLENDIFPGAVPLTFEGTNLDVDDILALTGLKRTGSQLGVLHKAIRSLKSDIEYYTLYDIIARSEQDRNAAKWNVINAVERLDSYGLFSEGPTPMSEIVRSGHCSVINMKGIKPHLQEMLVARLISAIFQERKTDAIPPLMLVVEEAHNYCPQKRTAIPSEILTTVASEGRKFGLGLCIVTQRPARVNKNILSQCSTQVILQVTNPNDLKAIIASVEGLTSRAANEIQRLAVGEAIVVGANIAIPIFVNIRVRRSKHGGKSITIIKEKSGEEVMV